MDELPPAFFLGEVLVDACIWCKAHYVDVSMEAGSEEDRVMWINFSSK